MDVIVIGGGIVGVATAYHLRAAGHWVCIVEVSCHGRARCHLRPRRHRIAHAARRLVRTDFHGKPPERENGVVNKAGFNGPARQFVKQLAELQEPETCGRQYDRLRPLVELSREAMADAEARFGLEFEQTSGVLYLVRAAHEWEETQPALG